MVLGDYVCGILTTVVNAFNHSTTNIIVSITIRTGSLFNGRLLSMALVCSLIALICHSIFWTCLAAAVVFMVDLPVIVVMIFSNTLSVYNFSTYILRLY